MIDTPVPKRDQRPGYRRQDAELVGREVELERIDAFLATARTEGGAPVGEDTLVPGDGASLFAIRLDAWLSETAAAAVA